MHKVTAMKTKNYFLLLLLLLLFNSCSLFQLECENGYKYEFACLYSDSITITYHEVTVFYAELLQPEEAVYELKKRCVENGAFRVFVTVYKQYCNTTAHEPIYKTSIEIK